MAIVSDLPGTSKAPFSEGMVVLSQQLNLDYHSKSMADFFPPAVPMKKSSLISTVITKWLAVIWPCQGGGRDSSALMSWVMSSFLPYWSLHLQHDMTFWKAYSANLTYTIRAMQTDWIWTAEHEVLLEKWRKLEWHIEADCVFTWVGCETAGVANCRESAAM